MNDDGNKVRANSSDTLMLKYFSAVNQRSRLSMKRSFGFLKDRMLARRKKIALIKQKEVKMKQTFMEQWLGDYRNIKTARSLRYRKALYTVILYFKLWRRLTGVKVKAARYKELRERETIRRCFESIRFELLQQKTQVAKFSWTKDERNLKLAFQSWRDSVKRSSRLKLKLRLFRIKANRNQVSSIFKGWKDRMNTLKRNASQFTQELAQKKLHHVFKKWKKLKSSNVILNRFRVIAKRNWALKVYRAFFRQVKREMIDRLKSTLKDKSDASQRDQSRPLSVNKNEWPYQSNGASVNTRFPVDINRVPGTTMSPEDSKADLKRLNAFETYKQQAVKNIVDFRNQASDIKFIFNNLPSTVEQPKLTTSQLNNPLLSTVKSTQKPSENANLDTISRLNNTVKSQLNPHPLLKTTIISASPHKETPQANIEQILQTKLTHLETTISYLKVNKAHMTEEQRTRAKEEIASQIEKIKYYQNMLARNAHS